MRVLVGRYPHEDAGSAAAQRPWRVPGPFETLPYRFEHQPLLRIDPHGLARGDPEELRIESIDSVDESAEAGVDLARGIRIRVVKVIDVEAVIRDFADRIDTAGQHLPERLGIGRAGKTARDRDDRDRFVRPRRLRGRRSRRRLGLLVESEDVAEQVVDHIGDTGEVHHEGDGYLRAHSCFDAAAQFDGHQ